MKGPIYPVYNIRQQRWLPRLIGLENTRFFDLYELQ